MAKNETENGDNTHGLNVEVVGAAPATSIAQLYISGAQALALSYANNVNQQNLNHLVGSIPTVQNALAIQNIRKDTSADGAVTGGILEVPNQIVKNGA